METVDLVQAKDQLAELLERAARGEDVRIADPRLGTVKLQPVAGGAPYPKRIIGSHNHLAEIPLERLLAPLSTDELAWLSGEQSERDYPGAK